MEEFLALIAALQADDTPDTIYDDLVTSHQTIYDSNVSALGNIDTLTAQLAEKDATIQALTARVSEMEASNYEQAMNSGADDGEDTGDDSPEINGIDDLFDSKEEDN